jgi:hypothetical protein
VGRLQPFAVEEGKMILEKCLALAIWALAIGAALTLAWPVLNLALRFTF